MQAVGLNGARLSCFLPLRLDPARGSAVVPFQRETTGSTTFLPFLSDVVYIVDITEENTPTSEIRWTGVGWTAPAPANSSITVQSVGDATVIRVSLNDLPPAARIPFAAYVKAMNENNGWGRLIACPDFEAPLVYGDAYIGRFREIDLTAEKIIPRPRPGEDRPRIYQLLPRLFGNTNEARKLNGTIVENGCGKFADINDAALRSLKELGATHVWLTGVIQQATGTGYPQINEPADDPDLLKGLAGSPYAIKDYFDVCPDYALDPKRRLEEFRALLDRIHSHGLKAIIDFVPNHVARSYRSDIFPDFSFGATDDRSQFFSPANNFYYLRPEHDGHGPPLTLPTVRDGHAVSPTCQILGGCDGKFDLELDHGKVTGNNVVSWKPSINDWYETAKLNYGFDFTNGDRAFPRADAPDCPVPDTWLKMDRIISYWQEMGVDGFRCDMSHMVPPEFWTWLLARARTRQPRVWFGAEAYNNDPARVQSSDPVMRQLDEGRGHVLYDLLSAGFDAVYDDPSYKALKAIYDGGGWANDLDRSRPHDFIFQRSLRYAENHDEVRLASRSNWGSLGPRVGFPVSAILYGLSRGPVLLYSGQEVGEPASGAKGFSQDDGRSTIFDYWCMPELSKWVNGHRYDGSRLSPEQKALRQNYTRLLWLAGQPAFERGHFYGLNPANLWNERYGRLPGENASGHWLYTFLRVDPESGQRFLVAANLHPDRTLENIVVQLPPDALALLNFEASTVGLRDRLAEHPELIECPSESAAREGLPIPRLLPLSAAYFEIYG